MPSPTPSPQIGTQLPYALFIVALFFAYGQAVRRGRIAGRAILGVGALVGVIAVAASFFQFSPDVRAQTPLGYLLVSPIVMALCAAFCVAMAYRSQKVEELGRHSVGDTTVIARYSPASRIEADAILLAAPTTLRMLGGVSGALSVAGGTAIEREARQSAPANPGRVVQTTGGRLAVDHIFHAVAYQPLRPVEEAPLRRALENAAQQARKAGAETLAVPVGVLPGLPPDRVARIVTDAVLKHRRAFAEISFVALDVRGGQTLARAVAEAVAALTSSRPAARSSSPS